MESVSVLFPFLALLVTANAQLLGGVNAYEPKETDSEVIFAVKGINDFFASGNDNAKRTYVDIVTATSQIVRGALYRFEIEVSGGANGNEICEVGVWSQPWLTDENLREQISGPIKCEAKESTQSSVAAIVVEPEALHAFEKFLNRRLFNVYYMRVKNQPHLQKETSNGEETFNFSNMEMAYTNCMKSTASALPDAATVIQDCPVDANADVRVTCSATVVKSGDNYDVTSHQC